MLTQSPFWSVDIKGNASGSYLASILMDCIDYIGEADNCWKKHCEGRRF